VIRIFDIAFSLLGLIILSPILMLIYIALLFDTRSPIFLQERVGRGKKPFILVKFRTMRLETRSVASHLVGAESVTPFGKILRKLKLDELPQLFNVFKGEMSLVGPRPSLFSQTELISAREKLMVLNSRPGITGLAQLKKIDMSTPELLAKTDAQMLKTFNVKNYFSYIFLTIAGRGMGDAIGSSHPKKNS
jgi:O-antigen biosynthesis protein WbqP